MKLGTGIVALLAGCSFASHALGARVVDSFDHTPDALMEMWVGQPSHGAPNTGTAHWRGRLNDVIGGFRAGELEHRSSLPGRFVQISEGVIPGAMVYDGQPGSSAALHLEYSTGGSIAMDLSAPSDRYLEIDVLYADAGGVQAIVELVGGETQNAMRSTVLSQGMSAGAQTLRFDLGATSGASLSATDLLRVTFDAGGINDVDYAIGEIRLVPAPASVLLGCAGLGVMMPGRRRRV